MIPEITPKFVSIAGQLNSDCRCISLDLNALRKELSDAGKNGELCRMIIDERSGMFAKSAVFLDRVFLNKQLEIIAALERVVALPVYQQEALSYAPETARFVPKAAGVFMGYDFHISADGPKLIEVNTNAGGALINALLIRAQKTCCDLVGNQQPGKLNLRQINKNELEQQFVDMFRMEWRLERESAPLCSIAIVDDDPKTQYMLPEFILFQQLFERHSIKTVICDPAELSYRDGCLRHGALKIDLVYNRLTDFSLEEQKSRELRDAYKAGAVVLTPHPRNHALYADKRNLALLCDGRFLEAISVDSQTQEVLAQGLAKTIRVDKQLADSLWSNRKQLFFKPAKGFGSKGAYRGDKLTLKVFKEILENEYVAQTLIKPSERHLEINHTLVGLKMDIRHYVYRGQTQLVCARLYQGQTTNFRNPGGGFAQVVVI